MRQPYPPAQQQYGAYPQYGSQFRGPFPPPPQRKSHTGIIVAISLAAVVLLVACIGVVGALFANEDFDATASDSGSSSSSGSSSTGDSYGDQGDGNGGTGVTGADFDEANETLRNFDPELGPDGTYKDAAEEMAALFDVEIAWTVAEGTRELTCDPPGELTIASICGWYPNLIVVNEQHAAYDTWVSSDQIINTMKHELSHVQIRRICDTTRPPIAEGFHEAVTESYSVRQMDATPTSNDEHDGHDHEVDEALDAYIPTPESDAAADAIYEGRCS